MNELALRYTEFMAYDPDLPFHGVLPFIDGVSLAELAAAADGHDRAPLGTWNYPAPGEFGTHPAIAVLDCTCTVHGCGGLDAVVEREDGIVRWAAFLAPDGSRLDLGPFEFDAAAYDAEVARVDAQMRDVIPWESRLWAVALGGLDLAPARRRLVGIAGAPGAGKSTAAESLLAASLGAAVLPMDGFHLPQAELVRLGRRDRMGAPDTFDVDGFVATLEALRRPGVVHAPAFDRTVEEPVPDAISIDDDIRVVIVEGNYLLHDAGGWERVRPLLDRAVLLAPDDAVRRNRLIARHIAFGKSPAEAEAWVTRSDDPNAALVARSAPRADVIFRGP